MELAEPDHTLLQEALALHDLIAQQMKGQEKRIAAEFKLEPDYERLLSLPGVGPTLDAVLAAEIDQIESFRSADKFCGYAGVVPTTQSSGGKVHHGRLLPYCNKWLRWALIEDSWVAIGCSPYFGALYRQQRARGKKANTAITIVAGGCAASSTNSWPRNEALKNVPRSAHSFCPRLLRVSSDGGPPRGRP